MTFVDALVEKFGLGKDHSRCTAIWVDPLKQWIENQSDVTEQIEKVFGETKTCPNCGQLTNTQYCPICGTKMKGEARMKDYVNEYKKELKEMTSTKLIDQLEWFGCDPYYNEYFYPLLDELRKRLARIDKEV